jgi:hypothetical protein
LPESSGSGVLFLNGKSGAAPVCGIRWTSLADKKLRILSFENCRQSTWLPIYMATMPQ